jgi:hypothetical protein
VSQTHPGQEQEEKAAPVLLAHLALIDRDMAVHPEHVRLLSTDSLDRARGLVGDPEVVPNEEPDADGTLDGSDAEP